MKLEIFKPEDFSGSTDSIANGTGYVPMLDLRSCSDKANAKLNEYLEKNGVRVYSKSDGKDWTPVMDWLDSKQAILINIQPIEKKCEKHEPGLEYSEKGIVKYWECAHCNKRIKPATWTEA